MKVSHLIEVYLKLLEEIEKGNNVDKAMKDLLELEVKIITDKSIKAE